MLEWLDAHAGAVQAISTVVLVGITAIYVLLTYRQARASERLIEWETTGKSTRDREGLEKALAAEIHHAISYMDSLLSIHDPRHRCRVPPDFGISTTIYRSVAPQLGELSGQQLGRLVPLYRQFEELNRIPGVYGSLLQATQVGDPVARALAGEEAHLCADSFYRFMETVRAHARLVRPMIGEAPPPLSETMQAEEMRLASEAWLRGFKGESAARPGDPGAVPGPT